MCKVLKKFKYINDFGNCCSEFKDMVYDSLSIEMFETNQNNFKTRYNLIRNDWLVKLYIERESWALVHLNHRFWDGMTST